MRFARPAAWLSLVVAGLVAIRFAGTAGLGTPPLRGAVAPLDWVEDLGPVRAAVALLRVLAELALWYLLAVSALHVAGSLVRSIGAFRATGLLRSLPAAAIVRAGLGIGLVTSTTATPAGAASDPEPGTAVMRPIDETGATNGGDDPSPPHAEPDRDVPAATDQPPPAAMPPITPTTGAPRLHQVERGESLWSIAEDAMADTWGRRPTDREIDPFWRRVVESNRARLVGDDADLIFPGQVFEIPAVPPPPA